VFSGDNHIKNAETFIHILCDGAEMIDSENIIYLKTTTQYFIYTQIYIIQSFKIKSYFFLYYFI